MIQVFLVKRKLRQRHRWVLRWNTPDGWRCESTGTADRTQAELLRKQKWAELNIPDAQPEEQEPEPIKATWDECREALKRAMEADNLRPSYVAESVLTLEGLRRMFAGAQTPSDVTPAMALEYKRLRAENEISPWTIRSDLAKLKAIFGKWLGQEMGLLRSNPFANVKPPKCDDPDVRIVSAAESRALVEWLNDRWNNWALPVVYLEVLAYTGWRATETAALREEDLLGDGNVRVIAENCKTRKHKYGWLPTGLYADLKACSADGWAFGRFPDELKRLLILWRKRPRAALMVGEFTPSRLVYWMQDELVHFHKGRDAADRFSLHDFRRTAITGLQMAGVSEKETSLMVGATPEIIRKHYEKLEAMTIARRAVERREAVNSASLNLARPLRATCAQPLDARGTVAQNEVA